MSPKQELQKQPFLKYSDIDEDNTLGASLPDPSTSGFRHKHRPQSHCSRIALHSIVIVITSLVWIAFFKITTTISIPSRPYGSPIYNPNVARHNITTGASLLTCGATTESALTNNCTYSLLLNHWVPMPCLASDFTTEYLDDQSWEAFADANLTVPLTAEELGFRENYWTSARDHVNHCAMMWKLQFWALFEEWAAVDTIVASPGHTDHCAGFLMGGHRDKGATLVEIGFAGCWIRGKS